MSAPLRTALTLAVALGMAAAAMTLRAPASERFDDALADEDRYYLPPSVWLRAFSLGHNEALADLLWIKAVVYFGGLYQSGTSGPRRAAHTARYVTAITDLNPRFAKAYTVGSRFVLYHQRKLSRDTVEAAIEVLERGARVLPDNGEIAFGLGFFHYYELPPYLEDAQESAASRRRGAQMLRRAATMEGAPPYTALLGTRVLQREGLDELVVEHLRTMLISETDPLVQERLERQLKRELGRAAERDIRTSRALQKRWKQHYSHVPFDLFLLVAGDETYPAAEILDPLWLADRRLGLIEDSIHDGVEPGPR